MEFGSYASQQPCRTMYKPFSLLRNSSRSASALYAHINIYIISILTNENSLSSHRLLFLLQFLTILKFLSFFFFFLVKFQLQRKKRKTKTNTIDGKNSKSKFPFQRYPFQSLPGSLPSAYNVHLRPSTGGASAWQRSSFIPGL